ncbi:TPA: hypothetical protein ACS78C_003628 [Providencia alcalifaciens]
MRKKTISDRKRLEDSNWHWILFSTVYIAVTNIKNINIIDEGTRECLASLPTERVLRGSESLKVERGLPKQI